MESESNDNINSTRMINYDHLACCDKIGAAGQRVAELWCDWKCVMPGYALPKSTADTGAQCFLLGADHLPDLGLSVEDFFTV